MILAKNWRSIPEHPSYVIRNHTKCIYCPKNEELERIAKLRNVLPSELLFIEHFPPEYEGDKDTRRIMFVGETPGQADMRDLRPFRGRAGELLRGALLNLGYVREQPPIHRLLFTNTVKCRCVGIPPIEVMNMCAGSLAKEADLFSPDLIIGLGKIAFHALTDKGFEHFLGENRRKWFKYRGFPVRVTYHPAACFHQTNRKISLYQDLRNYLNWVKQL